MLAMTNDLRSEALDEARAVPRTGRGDRSSPCADRRLRPYRAVRVLDLQVRGGVR